MEGASLSQLALDPDPAAVGFHKQLGDVEAQADPARFTPGFDYVEAVEDMRQVVLGYPGPAVAYRYHDFTSRPLCSDKDRRLRGRVPQRVGEQVDQDTLQTLRVGLHGRQVLRDLYGYPLPALHRPLSL